MQPEDIEMISKKISDLNKSIKDGNITEEKIIRDKVDAIRALAEEKGVPIYIPTEDFIYTLKNKEMGVPDEYYEEESETDYSED